MTQQAKIGRIALRVEGDNWVAYWADVGTMEGAILLGSIAMAFVNHSPKRKAEFIELMNQCAADALEDILGTRPTWNEPHAAPENEKSGNA